MGDDEGTQTTATDARAVVVVGGAGQRVRLSNDRSAGQGFTSSTGLFRFYSFDLILARRPSAVPAVIHILIYSSDSRQIPARVYSCDHETRSRSIAGENSCLLSDYPSPNLPCSSHHTSVSPCLYLRQEGTNSWVYTNPILGLVCTYYNHPSALCHTSPLSLKQTSPDPST